MGSGETNLETVSGNCAADIGGALFCKIVPTGWQQTNAVGGAVDGLSVYDSKAGQAASFYQEGIHPVICGAAIANGDDVMSDAASKAVTFAAGSGRFRAGKAQNATTAAGQIVNVLLRLGLVAG